MKTQLHDIGFLNLEKAILFLNVYFFYYRSTPHNHEYVLQHSKILPLLIKDLFSKESQI